MNISLTPLLLPLLGASFVLMSRLRSLRICSWNVRGLGDKDKVHRRQDQPLWLCPQRTSHAFRRPSFAAMPLLKACTFLPLASPPSSAGRRERDPHIVEPGRRPPPGELLGGGVRSPYPLSMS
jgi:hypothetical protein